MSTNPFDKIGSVVAVALVQDVVKSQIPIRVADENPEG
jgi:hypothetical protein